MVQWFGNDGAGTIGVNYGITYGLKFKVDKDIIVSQLGLKTPSTASGWSLGLWDVAGSSSPLATAGLPGSGSGWRSADCTPTLLQANREYWVCLYHPNINASAHGAMQNGTQWYSSTVGGVTLQHQGGFDSYAGGFGKPNTPFHSVVETTFAMGLTFILANTAPNTPTTLSAAGDKNQPRLGWVFSDPDAGNTQGAFEVEVRNNADVLIHSSGKITSANPYYDLPASVSLAALTTYKFRVRTWDNSDAVGPYSPYHSWTTGKAYAASGTYTTIAMNLNSSSRTRNGTLKWTGTTPTGTSVSVEYRVSMDNVTWGAWTAPVAVPPGTTISVPPTKYLQVRFTLNTTVALTAPAVDSYEVVYPLELSATGMWISPVVDTFSLGVSEAYEAVSDFAASVPSGAALSLSVRSSADNAAWSAWAPVSGPFNWARYMQYRLELTANATLDGGPIVDDLTLTYRASYHNSGEWISPVIDLKGVEPASGTLAQVSTLNDGTVALYTRYRNDPAAAWTDWAPATGGNIAGFGLEMQVRVAVSRNAKGDKTPSVDSLTRTLIANRKRGVWISEVLDISQASDKTTGVVASDLILNGDSVQTQFQYSTNGSSWSLWLNPLSDGAMTTPADTTHLRIRHIVTGQNAEIKSTTVYFDGLPSATILDGGFQANASYDFTQLREILMICNGKDNPRKWDGTNPVASLGGSPPAFQMMETHINRAWGAGDPANPSRVRFSDILNPESWPALNFIDFNPEDGDRITALYRYGQQLIVSKHNSMALLAGDRSSNFAVVWLDHPEGVEGHKGVQTADKYLAYVARDGIRFSDLTKAILATEKLRPSWEALNHRRLSQAAMISTGNYLLCALPSAGSLVNDQVWFFDILRAAWSIIPNWKVSSWLKFRQYGEEVLLAGDSEKGQVYEIFTGTTDADGSYMVYDFQTKDFDAGFPERYKVMRDCILIVGGVAEESVLNVTFVIDGVEHPVDPADTTVPPGAGVVHSIRLIPPVYGAVLGQQVSLKLHGRNHIHAVALGLIVRGVVPGVS